MVATKSKSKFHGFGSSIVFITSVLASVVLIGATIACGGDLPNAKTGEKLPAGGGEPGKAYMAFVKAVKSDDIAAVRKLHTGTENESDSGMKEGVKFMKLTMPENLMITDGYATADRAALYVLGTFKEEMQYGRIEMVKKKEVGWQVGNESWSNQPQEK